MPVYGLPPALESSLNSLAGVRPPTSWRVSGHGNDTTVVLRWTECSSPSSDKTIHYDIDHNPKDRLPDSDWQQFQRNTAPQGAFTINGSTHSATSTKMETDSFRVRYSKTLPRRRHRISPVPMIITSSTSLNPKVPQNTNPSTVSAYNDVVDRTSVISADSSSSVDSSGNSSRCSSACRSGDNHSSTTIDISPEDSSHESQMRNGIRAYLNQEIEIDRADENRQNTPSGSREKLGSDSRHISSDEDSQIAKDQSHENTQNSTRSSPQLICYSENHNLISESNHIKSPKDILYEDSVPAAKAQSVINTQSPRAFESVGSLAETSQSHIISDTNGIEELHGNVGTEAEIPSFDLDMVCSNDEENRDMSGSKFVDQFWDGYDPNNDTEDLVNVEIEAESPPDSISDEM
ncbi:uncharacterized protein LOC129925632 [Biomphalaria glabrata]|uniref:Uncharacterized protein LOC129925632 n=1 Tax=Biomphalaria glabrata TaxID=6526 RepID=A0A9W3A227_BIOGL|nr:uncharacterized protein LOC129925632 [Biomphalaria glabrata]